MTRARFPDWQDDPILSDRRSTLPAPGEGASRPAGRATAAVDRQTSTAADDIPPLGVFVAWTITALAVIGGATFAVALAAASFIATH